MAALEGNVAIDLLIKLTRLLAAHGVYALVILFMFILLRRARKNVQQAKNEIDHRYYHRQHQWTLIAIFLFSGVAAAAWVYDNLIQPRAVAIEGTFKDLVYRPVSPKSANEPPYLVQSVAPFRTDQSFYSAQALESGAELFDLNWIIVAKPGTRHLQLRFQQDGRVITRVATPDGPAQLEPKVLTGDFRIDLDLTEALNGERLHLVYRPHPLSPMDELGDVFVDVDGEMAKIAWLPNDLLEIASHSHSAPPAKVMNVAWANPLLLLQALPAGSGLPEKPAVRSLLPALGDSDLHRQIAAQRALLAPGNESASLASIEEFLRSESVGSIDTIALKNLALVVNKLASRGQAPSTEAYAMLANALYERGDYATAIPFFEQLEARNGISLQLGQRQAISYFKLGDHNRAIIKLEQMIPRLESVRAESILRSNLGAAYAHAKRLDRAQEEYSQAIALDPTNVQARINLGYLHFRRNELAEAEAVFQSVASDDSQHSTALIGLGTIALKRKNPRQARSYLEQAIPAAPSNTTLLNNLAFAYAEEGVELDLALQYIERAMDYGGERPAYLDTKGWILYKLGRTIEAQELLRRALKLEPESDVILEHYQIVGRAAGDATEPAQGPGSNSQ